MIILGVVLLIVGLILAIKILWVAGVILIAVGGLLWFLGTAGHPIAGRRRWY